MEQLHLLQRRAEGAASQPDISDIFTVSKTGADEKLKSGKFPPIFANQHAEIVINREKKAHYCIILKFLY